MRQVFDRIAGSRPVAGAAARVTAAPLRVLAYHEIRDLDGFRRQVEHLVDRYRPVSVGEVLRWLDGGDLPSRSVWLTFDDADPSVVDDALPVLSAHRVPATMFVCPGVVDTTRPYWWQVVERIAPDRVGPLKLVPDDDRRRQVSELEERLARRDGAPAVQPQLTSAQLDRWLAAGLDVGNHTWDHPLLDHCPPEEQERQIRHAHDWLMDRVHPHHLVFAYPNGNPADHADRVLAGLGYRLNALFDHRLAVHRAPSRLSRLRTNADADLPRFRAIVGGVHPLVHALRPGGENPRANLMQ